MKATPKVPRLSFCTRLSLVSFLACFSCLLTISAYQAQAQTQQPRENIVIWHMLEPQQAVVFKGLLARALVGNTRHNLVLETGFDLANALLKLHPNQRLPDIVLAPSDLNKLAGTIPFHKMGPAWTPLSMKFKALPIKGEGVPIFLGNHLMLFRNKKIAPEATPSWESLLALSRGQKKPQPLVVWDYQEPYFFLPFYGHFLKESTQQSQEDEQRQIDRNALEKALRFYKKLAEQRVVTANCSYQCVISTFVNEQVPYILSGDWSVRRLSEQLGDKLGISALPSLQGSTLPSYRMPTMLFFPKQETTPEKKQALQRISRYLQSAAAQSIWAKDGARLVANAEARDEGFALRPNTLPHVYKLYEQAEEIPGFIDPLIWSALGRAISLHFSGTMSAPHAASLLDALIVDQENFLSQKATVP